MTSSRGAPPGADTTAVAASRRGAGRAPGAGRTPQPRLPCRIQLADGRMVARELAAARHRAIHLRMLHADSHGFVEITPGTRPPGETVQLDRRKRPEHFLPAGSSDPRWLARALEHCERILAGAFTQARFGRDREPCEECFVGVTCRTSRSGNKESVAGTRWLWVDIDDADRFDALHAFLGERPCQLLISSGGGLHAYWRLEPPLPATGVSARTGLLFEPIEQANGRLVARLGGDRACRDRSRVLRLLSVGRAISAGVSPAGSFEDASVNGRRGWR